jgi:hypothetical protein
VSQNKRKNENYSHSAHARNPKAQKRELRDQLERRIASANIAGTSAANVLE